MSDGAGPVIELTGVSKSYRVYRDLGRGWLRSRLTLPSRRDRWYEVNEAVRSVDLRVSPGEIVGVLGRNGSGKSTLLRLIAGLTLPTAGSVRVGGNVRCLLGTGVGFDPRFSGRENIIFGSLAMGIPREIAEARMDEIIEFAELDDRIDQPTMFYSSGMRTRLAAAVAFQEVPEVFMLDEALSAGDAYFTRKCQARIDEICASGSTLLVVTHSTAMIERLCTRALMFEDGRLVQDGEPAGVIGAYEAALVDAVRDREESAGDGGAHPAAPALETPIVIEDAYMCGADGARRATFELGEPLEVRLLLRTTRPVQRARFSLELYASAGRMPITTLGSRYVSAEADEPRTFALPPLDGVYELVMSWPSNPLGTGDYHWEVAFWPPGGAGEGQPAFHFERARICGFKSESFPGGGWLRRPAIIEPASEVQLRAVDRAATSP